MLITATSKTWRVVGREAGETERLVNFSVGTPAVRAGEGRRRAEGNNC